jgi:hypothetical protein
MTANAATSGPSSYKLQEQTVMSIPGDTAANSQKSSTAIEKGEKNGDFGYEVTQVASVDQGQILLSSDEPFPDDPDAEEEQQFTVRAVLVGCILGGVIAASK